MPDSTPDHASAAQRLGRRDDSQRSTLRRSWHAMADIFSPFSSSALASLPKTNRRKSRTMSTDATEGPSTNGYQATGSTQRRQPAQYVQAAPTPIKVEPKVWFANERTWISYLNTGLLLGTMALVLFNAARDNTTRYFAYAYAVISVLVMVYGYVVYQHRITLIRRRDPGHFDQIIGPLVICALLFVAVLTNFLVRWREAKRAQPDGPL